MRLVCCRKCRTVGDGDRYLNCFGCSATLSDALPAPRWASVTVHRAERDALVSRRTLWLMALIFLAAIPVSPLVVAIAPAFGAFVLLLYLVSSQILRRVGHTRLPSIIQGLLYLLGLLAAVFGAFLLVALACSVPLSKFD